jgi:hypothetical protein
MSRRSTPERLHQARREATRLRLIGEGEHAPGLGSEPDYCIGLDNRRTEGVEIVEGDVLEPLLQCIETVRPASP